MSSYLRAGEWVEIRSQEEILATLDDRGCLDHVPFMPEMFQYCGQRARIFKRADKTCDPGHEPWSMRRVVGCVHLEGLRCDGGGHGGCEAGCLLFWKEEWIQRLYDATLEKQSGAVGERRISSGLTGELDTIWRAAETKDADGETIYSCQATTLRNFSSPLSPWDPRQYVRDLRSGNLSSGMAKNSRWGQMLESSLASFRLMYAILISMARRFISYPYIMGAQQKTPVEILGLRTGELVQVRSKEEIEQTLDRHHRNRGLLFDGEMLPYCGGIFRVLRRVNRIIDERSGKMIHMKYPCIVLEGVVCRSDFHRLCPRAIYAYWRESWLKRVPIVSAPE